MNRNNALSNWNSQEMETKWFQASVIETISALALSASLVLSGCANEAKWSKSVTQLYNTGDFKLTLEQRLFWNKVETFYSHEADEEMRKLLKMAEIMYSVEKKWEEENKEWITNLWDYLIIKENWKVSVWYIWNNWDMFITDLEILKKSAKKQLIAIEKSNFLRDVLDRIWAWKREEILIAKHLTQ